MSGRGGRREVVALLAVASITVAVGLASCTPSQAAPEGSLALLERARENTRSKWSWKDRRQTLTLTIVDGLGNERVRKLVMLTRREGDGEKTLVVFLEPASVRGTAFLRHAEEAGPPAQWLHLPELGRTRQITSKARHKSFMGTDFSYADLDIVQNVLLWSPQSVEARPIGPAPNAPVGSARFLLRQRSDTRSYDHVTVEISEADVWVRRMEMFADADGTPTKMLRFENIREVSGIPTAMQLVMKQPEGGSVTTVNVSDLAYDIGLGDDHFTKRALERGLDHVD